MGPDHPSTCCRIAFLISTQDPASCAMKQELLNATADNPWSFSSTDEQFQEEPVYRTQLTKENAPSLEISLYTTQENPIFFEEMDAEIDADHIIVLSKHTSQSKKPAFCVHSCGNFASAELGGKEGTLCTSAPLFQTAYFRTLSSLIDEFNASSSQPYEAVMECTHHGPFIKTPLTFVEIGSSKEEWAVPENARFVRKVLYHAMLNYAFLLASKESQSIAIAIGGPHYTPHISKYILTKTKDCSVGHILPKYNLAALDEKMIQQMIKKTPGCTKLLIDWKGISGYKEKVRELWGFVEQHYPDLEIIRM